MAGPLVFVTSADLGHANGPALHVLNLMHALAENGEDLVLIAADAEPVLPLHPRVQWHRVRNLRRAGLPGGCGFLLMLPALWKWRHAEAMIVRSAPLSIVASLFVRIVGVARLVIEINGWIGDEARSIGASGRVARLLEWTQKREVPLAHALRTVTPELASLAGKAGGKAIAVIPTGTRLDLFTPTDRASARAELGLPAQGTRLIYLGNLWAAIDLKTVIEALCILQARGEDIQLDIVGGGPAADDLKALAARHLPPDRFRFFGRLSPAAARLHVGAADLALAPFQPLHGGLSPLKLRDYAACGRIVVASDLPGVIPAGTGDWLFPAPACDPQGFAAAIMAALEARSEAREQAARHYAEGHFGWASIARTIRTRLLTPPQPRA